jgi:peptidoglycan/xylan/chitin deacetylase (PgdA/CDA1 family)
VKDALTQLRSSLDRLRSEGREIDLFFRDDDVDEDENSLRRLLSVFLEEEAPVNLQIIPGRLTPAAASLLLRHHRSRPDLFEFNQHGWRHINHEREVRKCEFGPSRNFAEQLADIASGRRVLEEALGGAFSLVFTPPWNRCTAETLRALDRLGFQGYSGFRSGEPIRGYGFRDVSVTLDLHRWRNGVAMKRADEIVSELIAQLRELDTIGIMLHHKVMDEDGFDLLARLLEELSRSETISFHRFQSLPSKGSAVSYNNQSEW